MKPKRVAVLILAGLFFYLSLYTWNLRTGHLDALSSYTGLEVSGWMLRPGKWMADKATTVWERYVFLVGLRQENERLRGEIQGLVLENSQLTEASRKVARLEHLMDFEPLLRWTSQGARVAGQRLGPAAALDSIVLDKGNLSGIAQDMPVITPDGMVGRVMRVGLSASTVLLLHDPNSAIPVISRNSRIPGMAYGRGPGAELSVRYMNVNARLEEGEVLVTSGLSGIYPKGVPVAEVASVQRSNLSLFLTVRANPLVDPSMLEEVLLLRFASEAAEEEPQSGAVNATGTD